MAFVSVRDVFGGKFGAGVELEVRGWVRTHRKSKQVSFIELSDGSFIKGLQLVVAPDLADYSAIAERLATGASISARGLLKSSPGREQAFEIDVKALSLIGEANAETYPLQKKGHTLEFLREHLELRARSNTLGAVFRVRSELAHSIQRFFHERDFYWIHTPIITTSDCEGAGAMFQVTTLNLEKPPLLDGKVNFKEDFFGEKAHLTVSGQLEAEMLALALTKVYTFGPTFRAENSNTTRHLSEFWMIEPEVAFNTLEDNISLAEDFLRTVLGDILNRCGPDLEFLHQREWASPDHLEMLKKVSNSKFAVMDYSEAISVLEKCGKQFEFPPQWGMDLQAEHERFLTDEFVKGPVFVVNYPRAIKAFYMRVNESDPRTVRAMDLLVPRLGEIIGGSQREERLDVLLERLKECHIEQSSLQWYLNLRRFGSVPHAGFGLGFERFLMYITGMTNVRDVIPCPRTPGNAKG